MMLIGLLGFGMIVGGCDNGTTPTNGDNVPGGTTPAADTKVVAEKYRGMWQDDDDPEYTFKLTENRYFSYHDGRELGQSGGMVAWTDGADLYTGQESRKSGTFTSDTTYDYLVNGEVEFTYTKQP